MACGSGMRMRCMGMGCRAEIASSLGLGRRVGRGGVTWGSTPNLNAFARGVMAEGPICRDCDMH
jgi:hypothetical protein